jgi:hypothetical protein
MEEPKISDIPSIQKTLEDMRNISTVKEALPILRPILRLLGTDVDKLKYLQVPMIWQVKQRNYLHFLTASTICSRLVVGLFTT